LESTQLPIAQVAFAAGFSSVRQFNETVRSVFALTPSGLRAQAKRAPNVNLGPGILSVYLAARQPFAGEEVLGFLGARAVTGIEAFSDGVYSRSLRLPFGDAVVALRAEESGVRAHLQLEDLRDVTAAVARCRRLLDLDADAVAIAAALGAGPVLRPVVQTQPGRRMRGAVDGDEIAFRTVLGQQVSVKAARGAASALVATAGRPLERPIETITHTFPSAAAIADLDPAVFRMPARRASALRALGIGLATGEIRTDPGADRDELTQKLMAIPGIGAWTATLTTMSALGDPDCFPEGDLGVRRGLEALGHPLTARGALELADHWRPWRSYAVMHLWAATAATSHERNENI
jgi:AraC family transcriptional regulator, regulatory protein of adaptative response / DNA-3-methyladenine glycosylase II